MCGVAALQDDYSHALIKLHQTVGHAIEINSAIKFEVFIHKVDGLSDDRKIGECPVLAAPLGPPDAAHSPAHTHVEVQRDIQQRITDDLADAGMDGIQPRFHLTSIYDHSIFEAFSKVVQKLIPQLPTLENLLNILVSVSGWGLREKRGGAERKSGVCCCPLLQHCGIEKAFLFDVVSKIYIATDSSLVDMQAYELCCDMIDVVIDVSCIYGWVGGVVQAPRHCHVTVMSLSCHLCLPVCRLREGDGGTAYDTQSSSVIRLNNSTVLYLREVNKYLALVCLLREDSFEKQGKSAERRQPEGVGKGWAGCVSSC